MKEGSITPFADCGQPNELDLLIISYGHQRSHADNERINSIFKKYFFVFAFFFRHFFVSVVFESRLSGRPAHVACERQQR